MVLIYDGITKLMWMDLDSMYKHCENMYVERVIMSPCTDMQWHAVTSKMEPKL